MHIFLTFLPMANKAVMENVVEDNHTVYEEARKIQISQFEEYTLIMRCHFLNPHFVRVRIIY